jgi:lysophospholipase L1-like esterase
VTAAATALAVCRIAAPAALGVAADEPARPKVRIVLVGDSTVIDDGGWGGAFAKLLGPDAECVNLAKSGRSSRSYRAEGHWQKALEQKPAYILIQFGHNDMPGKGPERETDPDTTFRENLARYVEEARQADARPILVTPMTRRLFTPEGKIKSNLVPFAEAVQKVAQEKKVPLVDLHARSIELLDKMGPKAAAALNRASADPARTDLTHLSPKGAEVTAPLVVEELARAVPELRAYLKLPAEKKPEKQPTLTPLVRTIDLNVGQTQEVELADGKKVAVKLLDLREERDDLRGAVRKAEVTVEVAGQKVTLVSANYRLPVTVAGVQIDCAVTRGYRQNSSKGVQGDDPWGLDKDARLRLWPAGSPLMNPGTFIYPARQRWFASATHMANEPVHVDGGEDPLVKQIYYHYGLDIGGAEALVEVMAATDGVVVSSGKEVLPGYDDTPAKPRYDVVYVLDARGWYYRYSHLHTISPDVKPGAKVKMGQRIGLLGKEGGSGGWSHLHFDIFGRQPSGKWGVVEGYAFLWEAYLREHKPKLLAVARPHQLVAVGQKVILDGSRSWSAGGRIASYEWTFTDGKTATGALVERTYDKPGVYSEVLKITDGDGRMDYDFAVVNVLDREHPDRLPPSIHAVCSPTVSIKPGDPVTFLVRTFRTTDGKETWDFGDGSPKVQVQSDGNVVKLAKDGYARTVHAFEKPGHYLIRVERTDRRGYSAIAHLHLAVGSE